MASNEKEENNDNQEKVELTVEKDPVDEEESKKDEETDPDESEGESNEEAVSNENDELEIDQEGLDDNERQLLELSLQYERERAANAKGKGKGKQVLEAPCPVIWDGVRPPIGVMTLKEMFDFTEDLMNKGSQDYFFKRTINGEEQIFYRSLRWEAGVLRAIRSEYDQALLDEDVFFECPLPVIRRKRIMLEMAVSAIGEAKKIDENGESLVWSDPKLAAFLEPFPEDSNLKFLIRKIIERAIEDPKKKYPTYLPGWEPDGKNIWNQPVDEYGNRKGMKGKGKNGFDDGGKGKNKGDGKKGNKGNQAGKKGKEVNRDPWINQNDGNWYQGPGDNVNLTDRVNHQTYADIVKMAVKEAVKETNRPEPQRPMAKNVPDLIEPPQSLLKAQSNQLDPNAMEIQAIKLCLAKQSQSIVDLQNSSNQTQDALKMLTQALTSMTQKFDRLLDSQQPTLLNSTPQIDPVPQPVMFHQPLNIQDKPKEIIISPVGSSSDLPVAKLLELHDWPDETSNLKNLLILMRASGIFPNETKFEEMDREILNQYKVLVNQTYPQGTKTLIEFTKLSFTQNQLLDHPQNHLNPAQLNQSDLNIQKNWPNLDLQNDEIAYPKMLQCVICLKHSSDKLNVSSPSGGPTWASCEECRSRRKIWPVMKYHGGVCKKCNEKDYIYYYSARKEDICFACDTNDDRAAINSVVKCVPESLYYVKVHHGKGGLHRAPHDQIRLKRTVDGEKLSLLACPEGDI